MLINSIHSTELNSSIQKIRARVEIHEGSTLMKICNCGMELSDFTVERTGEGKFFGYGICQKLKVNFLDETLALSLTKNNFLEATFGVNNEFIYPFQFTFIWDKSFEKATSLCVLNFSKYSG